MGKIFAPYNFMSVCSRTMKNNQTQKTASQKKTNIKKTFNKSRWRRLWCTLFAVSKELLNCMLAQSKASLASSVFVCPKRVTHCSFFL